MSDETCPECGGAMEIPSSRWSNIVIVALATALIVNGLGWTAGLVVACLVAAVGWWFRDPHPPPRCVDCGYESDRT